MYEMPGIPSWIWEVVAEFSYPCYACSNGRGFLWSGDKIWLTAQHYDDDANEGFSSLKLENPNIGLGSWNWAELNLKLKIARFIPSLPEIVNEDGSAVYSGHGRLEAILAVPERLITKDIFRHMFSLFVSDMEFYHGNG